MSLRDDIELLVRQNEALVKTLAKMGVRLDASLKLLSAITSLTALPVQNIGLDDAADEILEVLIREISDINSCSLLLYNSEKAELRLLAAKGQADLLGEIDGPYNRDLAFKPGEGVAGRVFQTNEPIFWDPDFPEIELLERKPELSTPASLACLPLPLLGRPIGVLNISFGAPRPFDHPRKRDLILLTGVIANTMQTLHLKAELDERAMSLRKKVLARELEIGERRRFELALRRSREELEQRVRDRTADLAAANVNLQKEILEHRRTAEASRKSEKYYRDVFDGITDFIFAHDLDGRFLSVNPHAARSLGYDPDDLIGRSIGDLVAPGHRRNFHEDYLARLRDRGRLAGTFVLRDSGGGEHVIEYRCNLVDDPDGNPYVCGTGRDVIGRDEAPPDPSEKWGSEIKV